jgi:hypothetical protein
MQLSVDAMSTALRVLSAIVNQRDPDPVDVEELRRLPAPRAEVPLDELACGVIQQARMDLGLVRPQVLSVDLGVRPFGRHRELGVRPSRMLKRTGTSNFADFTTCVLGRSSNG